MPRRDTFGSQPPLELLRQWIDYKSWYDREKIVLNHIDDLQLITAMGPPGGGRQIISNRLMSCFHTITYTVPSEGNMMRIYGQIVDIKFSQGFLEEVKNLKDPLAQATINIFNIIQAKFLPTPASTHYVFNMRDISKVFTGVYMAHKDYFDSGEKIVKLWAHEVLRVFSDRLNTDKDREVFKGILNDQLQLFDYNYEEHCATEGADAVFVDFLNDLDEPIYNEVTDFDKLRSHLND
jgi:dynein heavy chain